MKSLSLTADTIKKIMILPWIIAVSLCCWKLWDTYRLLDETSDYAYENATHYLNKAIIRDDMSERVHYISQFAKALRDSPYWNTDNANLTRLNSPRMRKLLTIQAESLSVVFAWSEVLKRNWNPTMMTNLVDMQSTAWLRERRKEYEKTLLEIYRQEEYPQLIGRPYDSYIFSLVALLLLGIGLVGLGHWKKLYLKKVIPLLTPASPSQSRTAEEDQGRDDTINWKPALISTCVTFTFLALSILAYLESGDYIAVVIAQIGFIPLIAAIFFASKLHYKCWQAINPQHRVTTPGKAVGLMFIPFYNFYWAFITWPKMVEGLKKSGHQLRHNAEGLAVAIAILFICIFIPFWTSLSPLLVILINASALVVFILLYRQIVKAINLHSIETEADAQQGTD